MRFYLLPSGTFAILSIVIVLLTAWLFWGSFNFPEALWAPGDLSRYHADVSSCRDCHTPFQGTTIAKCAVCHNDRQFAERSQPKVSAFHRQALNEGGRCIACHTEHRGALAQITVGAMQNPHGEFVFRATGTRSCTACHDFSTGFEARPKVLDNLIVSRLLSEGDGFHRRGNMTHCLKCHEDGRLDIDTVGAKD